MFTWLKANPLIAGAGFLLLAFAIYTAFIFWDKGQVREEQNLKNLGATGERLRTNEEIVNAVEAAQRPVTANELTRVCSKYDRNRSANCP